jgi:hypothetical protein
VEEICDFWRLFSPQIAATFCASRSSAESYDGSKIGVRIASAKTTVLHAGDQEPPKRAEIGPRTQAENGGPTPSWPAGASAPTPRAPDDQRIKRHRELGALVTAVATVTAAERAA